MRAVYKYKLNVGQKTVVPIPDSATPLSIGTQGSDVMMWVDLETNDFISGGRAFIVVGTGWDMCGFDCDRFIGTAHAGLFVWHVYEATKT